MTVYALRTIREPSVLLRLEVQIIQGTDFVPSYAKYDLSAFGENVWTTTDLDVASAVKSGNVSVEDSTLERPYCPFSQDGVEVVELSY